MKISWKRHSLQLSFQVLLFLFIYACTGSKPAMENSSDFPGDPADSLVASLERTRCFGACPNYSIKIYRSGYVLYEGYDHVPNVGRFYTWLTKEQLHALGQKAESVGYFELENEYRNPHLTDFPTIYSEVRYRGNRKKVTHYTAAPPRQLVEMEDYIDSLFPKGTSWILHPVQEIKE